MFDILDKEIWIGLFTLTAVLYLIKFLQSRTKKKVYRISPESLNRSKQVLLTILPLVEDDRQSPLDDERLPYPKDSIKNAAKILAYYYWKQDQSTELMRVKNAYISLSRFQNRDLEPEMRLKRLEREKKRLTREFESYIAHSPFNSGKAA